ncbi:MAG TPA: hypothetical protein VH592_03625 [Gemmataceae bacterium]
MKWTERASTDRLVIVLSGGLLFLFSGCGYFENAGSVSGTVSYKGQSLSEGSVSFVSDNGKVVTGPIDKGGRYSVSSVPIGSAKVTVSVVGADGTPPISFAGPPKSAQGTTTGPKIPVRYAVTATSGLQHSVTKGRQQFDIDLKD